MVFAMDGWYTYTIIIGARNQHTASGAYEFHIHRAYIIYDETEEMQKIHAQDLGALKSLGWASIIHSEVTIKHS